MGIFGLSYKKVLLEDDEFKISAEDDDAKTKPEEDDEEDTGGDDNDLNIEEDDAKTDDSDSGEDTTSPEEDKSDTDNEDNDDFKISADDEEESTDDSTDTEDNTTNDTGDDVTDDSTDTEDDTSGEEDSDEESKLYASLSDKDKEAKNTELKGNYRELYMHCDNIIEKLNAIPKETENNEILGRLISTLSDLKVYIEFYLSNSYNDKSYIENDIMFNKYLNILNGVKNIIKDIKILIEM